MCVHTHRDPLLTKQGGTLFADPEEAFKYNMILFSLLEAELALTSLSPTTSAHPIHRKSTIIGQRKTKQNLHTTSNMTNSASTLICALT